MKDLVRLAELLKQRNAVEQEITALDALPDFYLVLAGPRSAAMSSRRQIRPCIIESVFLFDAHILVAELKRGGVKFSALSSLAR
jgi:hypothetical protein